MNNTNVDFVSVKPMKVGLEPRLSLHFIKHSLELPYKFEASTGACYIILPYKSSAVLMKHGVSIDGSFIS